MPKILYNNSDVFLVYWIDEYFDLREKQLADLKSKVEKFTKDKDNLNDKI